MYIFILKFSMFKSHYTYMFMATKMRCMMMIILKMTCQYIECNIYDDDHATNDMKHIKHQNEEHLINFTCLKP